MASQDTAEYKDLYNKIIGNTGPNGFVWNSANTADKLNSYGSTFQNLFTNLVGRAPTDSEMGQIFKGVGNDVLNSAEGFANTNNLQLSDKTKNYINDNFQQAAKDQATKQLSDQQGQASSLADLFRTQGRQAISSTEGMLQDYQSRLFDRLRPQLITSLQSQGLLNTGGLNEAMSGAQQDLAASAQGYLADANLQNENQANAIAYGGAAAPYQFQQGQIMNQVPYLQSQGGYALDRGYQQMVSNQDYARQIGLMNLQGSIQRSMDPGIFTNWANTAARTPFAGSNSPSSFNWGGGVSKPAATGTATTSATSYGGAATTAAA